jgi:hypothetical protein
MKKFLSITWLVLSLIFSIGWLFYFLNAKLANPGGFSMGYGAVYFLGLVIHVIGFVVMTFVSPSKLYIRLYLLLITIYSIAGVLVAY